MVAIFIYIPNITNRHRYVCAILSEYIGIPCIATSEYNPKAIIYGKDSKEGFFSIYDYGLLSETGIKSHNMENPIMWKDTHVPFPSPKGFELPFDIFSAIFYYLTHYDMYIPHVADVHGRIRKEDTIAFRHNNHKAPVVEYWIHYFVDAINTYYHLNISIEHKYSLRPTMDIDHYSLLSHRGVLGNLKGKLYARKYPISILRQKGWINGRDPFQIFNFVEKIIPDLQYFLLLQSGNKDSINLIQDNFIRNLLIDAGIHSERIGIHFSYHSTAKRTMEDECFVLKNISGRSPKISRAHFLRYTESEYFQNVENLSIEEDFSLGYYDTSGFITGMSRSYLWYNLLNEEISKLRIQPFSMMDAMYVYYNKVSNAEISRDIEDVKSNIKKVNGVFSILLHNDILSLLQEEILLGETIFINIFS